MSENFPNLNLNYAKNFKSSLKKSYNSNSKKNLLEKYYECEDMLQEQNALVEVNVENEFQ